MSEIITGRMIKFRTGYYTEQGNHKYKVTNWHFEPIEKIYFEDSNDVFVKGNMTIFFDEDDFETHEVVLDLKAFETTRTIRSIHPDAVTNVTQFTIGALKEHIVKLTRSEKCKTQKAIKHAGIIVQKDKLIYCHKGFSTGDVVAYPQEGNSATLKTSLLEDWLPPINTVDLLKKVIRSHYVHVPSTILLWCFGVMAKRFTMDRSVRTPILFSMGRHNSGKTALHKKIIGNFFYMLSQEQIKAGQKEATMHNISGQSIATLQRLASLSNLHPLMLDEFKYHKDESIRLTMSDFLRNAYDEADVQKAMDASGKMFTYKNVRPISITGESSFKNEGAIMNRSIIIRHKSFTEEQKKLHYNIAWEDIRVVGQNTLRYLLKQQGWNWRNYPADPGWEIDSRNADSIEFLENGRILLNTIAGEEIVTEEIFEEIIKEYLVAIKCEDHSDAEELFGAMESFFLNMQHVHRKANPNKMIFKKGDLLYISFRPFVRWFERSKIPADRGSLTERLSKVGMTRYIPNPPREMAGYSMVFCFDWLEFKAKITLYDYPNVFAALDIGGELESNIKFNEV